MKRSNRSTAENMSLAERLSIGADMLQAGWTAGYKHPPNQEPYFVWTAPDTIYFNGCPNESSNIPPVDAIDYHLSISSEKPPEPERL